MEEVGYWMRNPQFACGGSELCQRLARDFPGRRYGTDQMIAAAGEPVLGQFVVLEGAVRVFHRSGDGRETLVKLLQAPATFGEMELLHDLPFLESVDAAVPSLVATLPTQAYLSLLSENPAVAIEQLRNLAGAFCVAARTELQTLATLEERVANLLVAYAEIQGRGTSDEPEEMRVDLTYQRIAECLGATRRGVLKVLSRWRAQGLIDRTEAGLQVLRPEELDRIARGLAGSLVYHIGKPIAGPTPEAHASRPRGQLVVLRGPRPCLGRSAHVDGDLLIGRASHCALLLPDEMVDSMHCRVFLAATGGRYWIEDLGSLNGTRVNGRAMRRRSVLRPGDEIQLGATVLGFRL